MFSPGEALLCHFEDVLIDVPVLLGAVVEVVNLLEVTEDLPLPDHGELSFFLPGHYFADLVGGLSKCSSILVDI